jgi:predicted permease
MRHWTYLTQVDRWFDGDRNQPNPSVAFESGRNSPPSGWIPSATSVGFPWRVVSIQFRPVTDRRVFSFQSSRPDRVEQEMLEELEAHVALQADALVREGMPRPEAERLAREGFGDFEQARRTAVASAIGLSRRIDRLERWNALWNHCRSAARRLRHDGLAIAAVISLLSVAIGGNAAFLAIARRLLLAAPAAVAAPSRVSRVWLDRGGSVLPFATVAQYEALSSSSTLDVAGYLSPRPKAFAFGSDIGSALVSGASASLFTTLGVQPAAGRFPLADEDSATGIVVLTDAFARAHALAVGSVVLLGPTPFRVIGIAPSGFTGAEVKRVDAWLPLYTLLDIEYGEAGRDSSFAIVRTIARLPDTLSRDRAAHLLTPTVRRALPSADSTSLALDLSALQPGRNAELSDVAAVWLVIVCLGGAAAIGASINAATILTSRAHRRRPEAALRTALGGGRGHLLGQQLAETAILAAGVLVISVLVAIAVHRLSYSWIFSDLEPEPFATPLTIAMLVAGGMLLVLLTHLPAMLVSLRTRMHDVIREPSLVRNPGRMRAARLGLVIAQIALAVSVATGAGLFLRSVRTSGRIPLGFESDSLIYATVNLPADFSPAEAQEFWASAVREAKAQPAIRSVSVATSAPYRNINSTYFTVRGRADSSIGALMVGADARYAATLGIRVVEGRFITEADSDGVVINESAARAGWPGRNPIGARITGPFGSAEVIGVVRGVRDRSIFDDDLPEIYLPLRRFPVSIGGRQDGVYMLVRARGDVNAAMTAARVAIARAMPGVAYPLVSRAADRVDQQRLRLLLGARLLVPLSAFAILIALVGSYALLAYIVTERRIEWAVRSAAGAAPRDISLLVIRQGARFVLPGIALGSIVAALLSPRIGPLLFGIGPRDPLTYFIVVAGCTLFSLIAIALPARRAALTEPIAALHGS